jgi:hypothetical protein
MNARFEFSVVLHHSQPAGSVNFEVPSFVVGVVVVVVARLHTIHENFQFFFSAVYDSGWK